MSGLVAGKVAIVTGGASGIGKSSVEAFVKEGANVVFCDIDVIAGERLAAELNNGKDAPAAVFVRADVTNSAENQHVVDTALRAWGRIDVLFNNAGIQVSRKSHIALQSHVGCVKPASSNKPIHEIDESVWDLIMNVNLKSIFLLSRLVIPIMLKQGSGVIINNSSGSDHAPVSFFVFAACVIRFSLCSLNVLNLSLFAVM